LVRTKHLYVTIFVSTDFLGAHHPLVNDSQVQDNGPVTGGVGALATSTPTPIPPSLSSSLSIHLVGNGFFALLAAAFGLGMTLM
jgi:hypothetical protein